MWGPGSQPNRRYSYKILSHLFTDNSYLMTQQEHECSSTKQLTHELPAPKGENMRIAANLKGSTHNISFCCYVSLLLSHCQANTTLTQINAKSSNRAGLSILYLLRMMSSDFQRVYTTEVSLCSQ